MIAVIFEYFYLAETKGCSEREKKNLYVPGAKYGRKLRPGESPIHLEKATSVRMSIADIQS